MSVRSKQLSKCCSVLSIGANALCAGGIFLFPLVAGSLKLTQPQLTTVVLAGMVGQYPFSAIVGKIIDKRGPATCSLIASILFALSFGLFSAELSKTSNDNPPSTGSFHRLTALFALAGLGTVFSYFSSLFSASRNFPQYSGVACGVSLSLFGLSPLFLSILASTFFTVRAAGLDVPRFFNFLAVLTGVTHLIGAFNLRTYHHTPQIMPEDEEQATEYTPLKPHVAVSGDGHKPFMTLLRDPHFWLLAILVLLILGSAEMVISNIGTIALSLPPRAIRNGPPRDDAATLNVRLLSISNTCSRLLVGPLADFMSPVASCLPCGTIVFPRKSRASRMLFLSVACFILAGSYLWMELGVRSQSDIWVLSIGTGFAYGSSFTVLPSIMSAVWGVSDIGRNFGVVTYSICLGTPLFSYLYAFMSAHYSADSGEICHGRACWTFTFWISFSSAFLSLCISLFLWRKWRGRM